MIELLAITPPAGPVDPDLVDAWLAAGVGAHRFAVLLREPGVHPEALLAQARLRPLVARCARADISLLISCDFEMLTSDTSKRLEGRCRGWQLRGDPEADALARLRAWWPDAILGRSVHGEPSAGSADPSVDYTCLAPIFAPRTSAPDRIKQPIGTATLRRWTAASGPGRWVVALGGVDASTAGPCLQAGARGLASIRSFFGEPSRVDQDVRALCAALDAVEPHATPPQ